MSQREERAATRELIEALPKCAWKCKFAATGTEWREGNAPACDHHACKRLDGVHFTELEYAEPPRAMLKLMAGWPKETT